MVKLPKLLLNTGLKKFFPAGIFYRFLQKLQKYYKKYVAFDE